MTCLESGGVSGSHLESSGVKAYKSITMSSPLANLASVSLTAKSNNNSIIGFVSQDGIVRFYDTSTSLLKTEFTPSSHLNTACTCLTWAPKSGLKQNFSKKKRRRTQSNAKSTLEEEDETNNTVPDIDSELKHLDLVAIGTTSGNILLFSVSKATIHSDLHDGHTSKTLTGHSTNIKQFYIYDKLIEENEHPLLFSSAENDRNLCCWKIHPSSTNEGEEDSSNACVTLTLTESIISFSVCALTDGKDTLDYTQLQQILKREDPSLLSISIEEQVTLTKSATKSTNATVLTQTISQPNMLNKQQTIKRTATEIIQTEVPLSERLNAAELHGQNSQIPTTDSLVTLLSQGLQSGDKAILEVLDVYIL
ncbi:unnamed protein product [Didymodactylos carnosus]|uniref:Uncharacterized protein n=1 Tax=Didymodactylos carnosus TaxID=1234261 RepID=A0A815J3I8_9BILA|nr:unnamed protein product [Didymodactylos carnosus]CAF1372814.1 unnamed protein product [Didymodactylos carnosus]CAF3803610.1 unnamed protein product [Didymodactylos carnosus]CAF4260705.1 unnamed protein product [Didymodactylos carnosus]